MKTKLALPLAACVLCALALAACKKGSSGPVVAHVGGDVITAEDFKRRIDEQSPFLRSRYNTLERKKELLDALVEVMSLRNDLRALRMRGLKYGPGRLIAQLGPDAALDPSCLAQLVGKGNGRYRLTPGMELVAVLEQPARQVPGSTPVAPNPQAVLEAARALVLELRRCA